MNGLCNLFSWKWTILKCNFPFLSIFESSILGVLATLSESKYRRYWVRDFFVFCGDLTVIQNYKHLVISEYSYNKKILPGWFAFTLFIHSLWRIANSFAQSLDRSFSILHNEWTKIVRAHQTWSNLYVCTCSFIYLTVMRPIG